MHYAFLKQLLPFITFFLGVSFGRLSSLHDCMPEPSVAEDSLTAPTNEAMISVPNISDQNQVHILYSLSGNKKEFIKEFSSSLKSSLLNYPLDRDMTIHVICDGKAYKSIGSIFESTEIQRWVARNQITVSTYNVESRKSEFERRVRDATESDLESRHTVGSFFRLFAFDILPPDIEFVIYMDTDTAILANLQDLWKQRNSTALFQWGEAQCSGFVMFNLKLMRRQFWKLVKETYPPLAKSGELDSMLFTPGKVRDQVILRVLTKEHPHLISFLTSEWDLHRADNLWKWKKNGLLKNRPKAGMVHMNGWEKGEPKDGDGNKFDYRYDQYGPIFRAMNYYGDHPWEWTRYIMESQVKEGGHGYNISVDYGQS